MIGGCALSPRAWTLRQRGYDRSGVKWRLKQIRYGLGELPSGSNIGWELPDVRRMRTAASWLGRHLQLACTLVSVIVITVAAGSAPGTAQGYSAAQLETVHPRHGIGVVFLGESRRRVQHALGAGHRITHGPNAGAYDYRSGRLTVELDYGKGHVDFVSTDSPAAVLYGHTLREGLSILEPIATGHGWTVLSCDGEVFTTLLPGGPGTGIAWKNGHLHEVVIDQGGSWGQQCEPE